MIKKKMLVKGSLVLALGFSSLFLSEKLEALPINVSYAASQEDQAFTDAKTSLKSKISILEDKISFAREFKKTRAYMDASASNKASFDKELADMEDAFIKANSALTNAKTTAELENLIDELSPMSSYLLDTLNNIYREDRLLSELFKANLAISSNKLEAIPKKYRADYILAADKIEKEYQSIWLDNKVYKEKEVLDILDKYQKIVKEINDVNHGNDIVYKIKVALKSNREKVDGIKYLMKKMPQSAKRYEKQLNEALDMAQKAIDKAVSWLNNHDK